MLKSLQRLLADTPPSIPLTEQREVKQSLDLLVGLIDAKGSLLERFKAKNAVLKNSVRYLPTAAQEVREELKDEPLSGMLEGLLWGMQQYNASTTEALERKLQDQLKQLAVRGNRLLSATARDPLERFMAHARAILEHTPVVNSLTTNLTWLPIGQWSHALRQTYEQQHARALARAARARVYFALCAALCLLYTLGMALWQSRQLTRTPAAYPRRQELES